jgi:hypothetical protein
MNGERRLCGAAFFFNNALTRAPNLDDSLRLSRPA